MMRVIIATLRFTTPAQQHSRLQQEIFELFLKNVDESIESKKFFGRFCSLEKLMSERGY